MMKLALFVAFLASAAYVTSAKKLLVLGGLNGLNGVNGGLLNPGLTLGGLNPGLIPGGGAVFGQQPFGAMYPGVPPYMLQPPMAPFGLPNAPPQLPQQVPFQPNGAFPFLPPMNRQVFPPLQQVAAGLNPVANGQQPQGDMPAAPVNRFRRALLDRIQNQAANSVDQATVGPSATEQPDE